MTMQSNGGTPESMVSYIHDISQVNTDVNYGQNKKERPRYQRDANLWDTKRQQKLIDTILRGGYIPPIIIRQLPVSTKSKYKVEVVDGQQRLQTLVNFLCPKDTISRLVTSSNQDADEFQLHA